MALVRLEGLLEDLGAVWQGVPGQNIEEYQSSPAALSGSGQVIGGVTGAFTRYAYIWTEATGMQKAVDFLTANGVTSHTGWDLRTVSYISPDGTTIVGTGFNPQ